MMGSLFGKLVTILYPPAWGVKNLDFSKTWHYPVFQVVDVNGHPTEHYQKIINRINTKVICKQSMFSWLGRISAFLTPNVWGTANYCNEGPGKLLYPPQMAEPPGPACRPFCN